MNQGFYPNNLPSVPLSIDQIKRNYEAFNGHPLDDAN
jgi:hypothetical protein